MTTSCNSLRMADKGVADVLVTTRAHQPNPLQLFPNRRSLDAGFGRQPILERTVRVPQLKRVDGIFRSDAAGYRPYS